MTKPLVLLLLGVTLVLGNPAPGNRPGGGGLPCPGGGGIGHPPTAPPAECRKWCKTPKNQVYCCDPQTYPDVKPGKCPPVRPVCPPTRPGFLPPAPCAHDGKCCGTDKCCFDGCLEQHVCKPPIY